MYKIYLFKIFNKYKIYLLLYQYNIFKNYIAVDDGGDDYYYECQLEIVLVDSVVVDRMVMVAANSG